MLCTINHGKQQITIVAALIYLLQIIDKATSNPIINLEYFNVAS